MPTRRASAVALETFTRAAHAARRVPRRREVLGLALAALRDDPADALGIFAAHRDLPASRRRLLALPPPDPGVLAYAVEDTPGGVVVVVLRALAFALPAPLAPRLGPAHALVAGDGWDRTAGPYAGLSGRQRALEHAARRLLRLDPHDALGVLEVAKAPWPLRVLRLPLGAGEVVYEVEDRERLVVLHELRWDWP